MNHYIIKKPIISEKSVLMAQKENKYTFEVDRLANKDQIVSAIEAMYGVHVIDVNTVRGHRVLKNTGRKRMRTVVAPTKKAIVRLEKGQKIDIYEFATEEQPAASK